MFSKQLRVKGTEIISCFDVVKYNVKIKIKYIFCIPIKKYYIFHFVLNEKDKNKIPREGKENIF